MIPIRIRIRRNNNLPGRFNCIVGIVLTQVSISNPNMIIACNIVYNILICTGITKGPVPVIGIAGRTTSHINIDGSIKPVFAQTTGVRNGCININGIRLLYEQ